MSSAHPFALFAQESSPSFSLPESLARFLAGLGLSEELVAPAGRLVLLSGALLVALVAHLIARRLILRGVYKVIVKTRFEWDDVLVRHRVFQRLTHLIPALVLHLASPLVFPEEDLRAAGLRVVLAYMVLTGVLVLNALLDALAEIYETSFKGAQQRPIKSYVQVVGIFFWVLAAILVAGALSGRSPWALLGGLGAMTAVLMLVFKDSLLGLVASVQLTANDMVRIGDWIEMPQFGADGNVEEILLTTVKVRNWDKTITTIPSYHLISDAFKNWRGMSESGVRRIRRAVLLDMHSVRFVDQEMLERFKKIQYIRPYLEEQIEHVGRWNREQAVDESSLVNGRRLTNLGTFRAYLTAYLRHHPEMDQEMTLMVHQLPPTEKGLPLQLYAFTKEQRWAYYETIIADIFDHLLAVVPEFDLKVVQVPTGADVRSLAAAAAAR